MSQETTSLFESQNGLQLVDAMCILYNIKYTILYAHTHTHTHTHIHTRKDVVISISYGMVSFSGLVLKFNYKGRPFHTLD
jgi:hypothetical protein